MSALAAFVLRLASVAAWEATDLDNFGDGYEAWVLLHWAADAYDPC